MPLAELFLTKGALSDETIPPLAKRITEIFLRCQGARPGSATALSIACLEVSEIAQRLVFVGGELSPAPRFRIKFTTPVGALRGESKANLVAEVTRAILEAEGSVVDSEEDACRVWCIIDEVPDGNWSSAGRIVGWMEVMRHVLRGDALQRRRERETGRIAAE